MSPPSLERQILGALRTYMDDSRRFEFLIVEVRGSGNLFVQFARTLPEYVSEVGDDLTGEVVGDGYLAPEELQRLDRRALERLGYAMREFGNYAQDWPLNVDLSDVARIAAAALRDGLGVDEFAPLGITTALGELTVAEE